MSKIVILDKFFKKWIVRGTVYVCELVTWGENGAIVLMSCFAIFPQL